MGKKRFRDKKIQKKVAKSWSKFKSNLLLICQSGCLHYQNLSPFLLPPLTESICLIAPWIAKSTLLSIPRFTVDPDNKPHYYNLKWLRLNCGSWMNMSHELGIKLQRKKVVVKCGKAETFFPAYSFTESLL